MLHHILIDYILSILITCCCDK